jgi:hypothetical protein
MDEYSRDLQYHRFTQRWQQRLNALHYSRIDVVPFDISAAHPAPAGAGWADLQFILRDPTATLEHLASVKHRLSGPEKRVYFSDWIANHLASCN